MTESFLGDAARLAHGWAEQASTTVELVELARAAPCARDAGPNGLCVTCQAKRTVAEVVDSISAHGAHIAHVRFLLATIAGVFARAGDDASVDDDVVLDVLGELPWVDELQRANLEVTGLIL